MKRFELSEGKDYRLIYKIFSYTHDDDDWEREYLCPKCGNNRWLVSYKTGTKTLLGEDVKLKCTKCSNWFITKTGLLIKVLGE